MDESKVGGREGFGSDRLRAEVLHQLPAMTQLFLGRDHVTAAINQATVDFYGGYNPMGVVLRESLVGTEGQGMLDMYDRALAGERVALERTRWAVVTPEGVEREVWLNNVAMPFRDGDGEIVGTIAMAIDVTADVQRERAEAEAAARLQRRYQRATDVIEEVQRALLPAQLPVLPAVDVAASYVVGGTEQAAGGDWFDIVSRPGGRVAAVVGDVVGHGVGAAASMAQLRAVCSERLHAGATVVEVAEALDGFVEVAPAGRDATVCIVEIDPDSGTLEYCSAGHPPPLVLDPSDEGRYLDPSGEGPIGTSGRRTSISSHLREEEVLLLYSDGIVERPGVGATAGVVELQQVAAAAVANSLVPVFTAATPVDRVTTQTLERLTRETGSEDDITLLALQRRPRLPVLQFDLDEATARTATVRARLEGWFRPEQVASDAMARLDQILTELTENAVEHGYGGAPGPLTIAADVDDQGTLSLAITDQGRWRPPPTPNTGRGLGLAIAQHLSDNVTIERSDDGTTVKVTLKLWKQSHQATPASPVTQREVFDAYVRERADQTILYVRGPADAAALDQLEGELGLATTPGSASLTVDLNDVTVLSSLAVQALRRSMERAQLAGIAVNLRCKPGTIAQQVLALVGLPTTTD